MTGMDVGERGEHGKRGTLIVLLSTAALIAFSSPPARAALGPGSMRAVAPFQRNLDANGCLSTPPIRRSACGDSPRSEGSAGGLASPLVSAVTLEDGSISGHVTAAAGGTPLEFIEVCAEPTTLESGSFSSECATTGKSGEYTIKDLPPGEWIVSFRASGSGENFAPQYYNGQARADNADPVKVAAGDDDQKHRRRAHARSADQRSAPDDRQIDAVGGGGVRSRPRRPRLPEPLRRNG